MVLAGGKPIKKAGIILFSVIFIMILNGCNRQTKGKLLRIFFDGVPVPVREKAVVTQEETKQTKEKDAGDIEEGILQPPEPEVFLHMPYSEGQCNICHDPKSSQRLIAGDKELCLACHDALTKDKKVVHFPAGEGLCLICHDPHQSPHQHILRKPLPELCFDCHDKRNITANPIHENQNICANCHNSHASSQEKLLN